MDIVGIVLAGIAQMQSLIDSSRSRMEAFVEVGEMLNDLQVQLEALSRHVELVKRISEENPNALSAATSGIFRERLQSIHEDLEVGKSDLENILESDLSPRCFNWCTKFRGLVKRFSRANTFVAILRNVENRFKDASDRLPHLFTELSISLKIENADKPPAYHLPTSAPALGHAVVLDFHTKDENGVFLTPEGSLKHAVLSSTSSNDVTVAAGKLLPAYGVVGMAGVGKTVALQGLAFDADIQNLFADGILYMSLGREATLEKVIAEVVWIMETTGASIKKDYSAFREVLDDAVKWFGGKACLFLVDDVWPTHDCETGYVSNLQQLLRDSPRSRMVVSTRSVSVALGAGSIVDFGARDPTGAVSEGLFVKYATVSLSPDSYSIVDPHLKAQIAKILAFCGGLPIVLSIAGCAVAFLVKSCCSLERACMVYAAELEKATGSIAMGDLSAGMQVSLDFLDADFLKKNFRRSHKMEHSISELYVGLCVLHSPASIPMSALSRLWQLDENATLTIAKMLAGMSLASLKFQEVSNVSTEACLILHDLQLEFCQRQAEEKMICSQWHSRFLDAYLIEGSKGSTISYSKNVFRTFAPRPWWSEEVHVDGYISLNIARHLVSSNMHVELGALLLHARWTYFRVRTGGILALQKDFEYLFQGKKNSVLPWTLKEDFKFVMKALQLSWGRKSEGERALLFQICGRLQTLREENHIVSRYLASVEANTGRPFLLPVSKCFPDIQSAQRLEIPVGTICTSVACSPCGRYIAAGAGHDIVVVNSKSGDVLKCLKGHSDYVLSVAFSEGSKNIFSGSEDKLIMLWKWEESDTPVMKFEGHSKPVTSVGIHNVGQSIFSGSNDRSLRIWDIKTGTQTRIFPQATAILSVARGTEDRIALGLKNGTLRVFDCVTGGTIFQDTKAHGTGILSITFSASGKFFASASWDKTVQLWQTHDWKRVGISHTGHEAPVSSLSFSSGGEQLVSASLDGTVQFWDGETRRSLGITLKHHSPVRSVSFTSDGKGIISGSNEGIVRIWDARLDMTMERQHYGHTEAVLCVAISTHGSRVASGSKDRTILLWDSESGKQIGAPLGGHTDGVNCLSFSPDGLKLVSGSRDGTMRVWDTVSCLQVGELPRRHTDAVWCISFSFDGLRIISGSFDHTVRVWNAETLQRIAGPLEGHKYPVRFVSESCDGRFIVSRDWPSRERKSATIIWNSTTNDVIWESVHRNYNAGGESGDEEMESMISDEQAQKIIRNCGSEARHLWPDKFPLLTEGVFCEDQSMYTHLLEQRLLVGNLPSKCYDWKYEPNSKVFAAGLESCAVAICRFICEG